MDIANFISQNHLAIVAVVGIVIVLVGLARFAFSASAVSVLVLGFGAVLTALPFITEASFGNDGFKLITNFQQSTKDLNEAVDANRQAIEQVRLGLSAVESAITSLNSPPEESSGTRQELENLTRQIQQSIGKASDSLRVTSEASSKVEQNLRANEVLIRRFDAAPK